MASQNNELADKLEALTAQLNDIVPRLREGSLSLNSNAGERMKLLKAIRGLTDAVKQPQDDIIDSLLRYPEMVAIRLFLKWKVFEIIPKDGPISYSEIASKLDADVALITRLSWMLGATGLLKQVGKDRVAHTPRSLVYASVNPLSAVFKMGFDDHLPTLVAMPKYFDTYGLKEPDGRRHSIFAFAMGAPELTVWEVLNLDPERMATFMLSMDSVEQTWPTLGSYKLDWIVPKAAESQDRPLVVDVGGGKGHCLKNMCKTTPGLAMDRCVLEDLPEVLDHAKKLDDPELRGARMVPVDFHAEQPVKGALVYYMRRCLHDYGDKDSVEMLQHLSNAMAEDSKLLIVEQVMSDPPDALASAADIFMATLGGKERTLENWRRITKEAGLAIQEVFTNPGTGAALIECVKA